MTAGRTGIPESRAVATTAARAAAAKQGEDIVILDVRDLIVITDYFVIASGTSERQVKTIVEEVEKALRARGVKPVRREGEVDARWVLLDFVDVVVHVFGEAEREYYDLERLWRDAPRVAWEEEPGVATV
ncbi:MAG TPA: ribosome silencing factor [Actinomycetota bacterium]|nr:ribosome silencing factor [Actinomycetota bacterium]